LLKVCGRKQKKDWKGNCARDEICGEEEAEDEEEERKKMGKEKYQAGIGSGELFCLCVREPVVFFFYSVAAKSTTITTTATATTH
jgi:hypothetical protein